MRALEGGDIKGRGGYVLIPPSVHPSGHVYRAVQDAAPILSVSALADVLPDPPAEPTPPAPELTRVFSAGNLWPRTTVERIKAGVDILSLLPPAHKTGSHWYMTHCPFHEDRHESMWVDTQHQVCGCYAGCTRLPLDVIDLYARLKGTDNKEAIKELASGLPREAWD